MKRLTLSLVILVAFGVMFSLNGVLAEACNPQVSLLNQDPYPAIPGEYVKIVFQVEGLDNPDCGDYSFELLNKYPLKFNPGETGFKSFKKVDFLKDYSSALLIPFEVRVDNDAVDGSNSIEVVSQVKGGVVNSNKFNLEVTDSKATFEVNVKDYKPLTHELTLEVLNIGKSNIKALAVEIPKQDGISVKGANRVIVGDLDSNEYTTADFEAIPNSSSIKIDLVYTDSIDLRRTESEKISYDSSYFTGRIADVKTTSTGTYVFYVIVIVLVVWIVVKKIRGKKRK